MHATITKHCLHHKAYLGSFSNGIGHTHMGTSPLPRPIAPARTRLPGRKANCSRRTLSNGSGSWVNNQIRTFCIEINRQLSDLREGCRRYLSNHARRNDGLLLRDDWYKYIVP